jgi:hypothetical protein
VLVWSCGGGSTWNGDLKIGAWKIACTVEDPECIRMEGIAAGGCMVLEDPEYTRMEGVAAGGLYSRFGDEI